MRMEASKDNFSDFSKQNSKSSSHLIIDGKFCLKSLKAKHPCYNFYKGIDISRAKWVHIYIKQTQSQSSFPLSKTIKEHLRNQLSPKVLWSGNLQIQKYNYFMEVHEKFGPSLQNVFDRINHLPSERQLLHLLVEMIKLVEKMHSLRYVSGQLDTNSIVFDPNPKKTELYLLNCFTLKKKNTEIKPIFTKYCSRGAHLGRSIGVKDDLESVCYILIDLFSGGKFLKNKMPLEYQQQKLSLKIQEFAQGLPRLFIDFYTYVINLNCSDDINFFYWKNYLTKVLTPDVVSQPYGFLLVKNEGDTYMSSISKRKECSQEQDQIIEMMEIGEDDQTQFDKHIEKVAREMPNSLRSKFRQI